METTPSAAMARRTKRRAGGILILIGAVAFAVMVLRMLTRIEPIEIVDSRLDRAGGEVCVEGLVRNTGSAVGAISLEVSYFDSHGRQVAEDKIALAGLSSGAETRFRSPSRRLEDAQEFTLRIDRGRNAYGN